MIDFGALWREESKRRRPAPSSGEWDERARGDVSKFGPGEYSLEFLQLAGLRDGESVFDMGCGAGSLAIPCVQRGHSVLAADFSPVMLQLCSDGLPADALGVLQTKLLAWDEDWEAAGVRAKSFDVAFASRSIATADLLAAVSKLSNVARRKVCVTVVAGKSPRIAHQMFADLGLSFPSHQDASFVFGVASQLGFEPEVSFIHSTRIDRFVTRAQARESYMRMLDYACPALEGALLLEAQAMVSTWVDDHLEEQGETADRPFFIDVPRTFTWAFISWEV